MGSKQHKVEQLKLELGARFGQNALRTARSLIESNTLQVIKTGYPRLDHALGGGVPVEHLTEITGTATSGTRTLAIRLIATAQVQGQDTVYMDCAETFAPHFAAAHGVDCGKLLLVRPTSCEQGLYIVGDLLRTKEVGLLVLDVGDYSPTLLRAFETVNAQMNAALSGSSCALVCVVSNGRHIAPPLSSFAALRLHIEHVKWLRKLKDVTGYRVRVHILKNRQAAQTNSVEITIGIGARP